MALFKWMGIATCTNEIMTAGVKIRFKIRNDVEMTWKIGNDVKKNYDVDVTLVYALPHSIVTRLPSQRWMPRRSHITKWQGYLVSDGCHVGAMDEVDVVSMSYPKQLCVRYKSSVITQICIVIVVLYDLF